MNWIITGDQKNFVFTSALTNFGPEQPTAAWVTDAAQNNFNIGTAPTQGD
jgi:hypothetical protein